MHKAIDSCMVICKKTQPICAVVIWSMRFMRLVYVVYAAGLCGCLCGLFERRSFWSLCWTLWKPLICIRCSKSTRLKKLQAVEPLYQSAPRWSPGLDIFQGRSVMRWLRESTPMRLEVLTSEAHPVWLRSVSKSCTLPASRCFGIQSFVQRIVSSVVWSSESFGTARIKGEKLGSAALNDMVMDFHRVFF